MGGGGNVEKGVLNAGIFEEVEDAGVEFAGMNGAGLAGFEPDFVELITFLRLAQEADEKGAVVVGFGDPVAAAEVEGGDLGEAEELAEVLIESVEGFFEVFGPLLAEGVEVEAGDAVEVLRAEGAGGDAEAGAGGAGVVFLGVAGGSHRVQTEAEVELAGEVAGVGEALLAVAPPLSGGVEVELRGPIEKRGDFVVAISRGAGENGFVGAGEVFVGEAGFPEAGSTGAVEVFGDEWEALGEGESFEGVDDATAGLFLDPGEDFQVGAEFGEVDEEEGRLWHVGKLLRKQGVCRG